MDRLNYRLSHLAGSQWIARDAEVYGGVKAGGCWCLTMMKAPAAEAPGEIYDQGPRFALTERCPSTKATSPTLRRASGSTISNKILKRLRIATRV
jgi:hypothetical protein